MRRRTIFGTAALMAATVPALSIEAFQMKGASYLILCERARGEPTGFCDGYMQAVVDGLTSADGICLAENVKRSDLVVGASDAIAASPELQQMNATEAVRQALRATHPC